MAAETPKGPSSRLLSMKFMQRAAASAQSTPGSESENTPSAKKRKLGHKASTDDFDLQFDQASVQAAIDERESKRTAALEKHAGNDTHWVLNSNWTTKKRAPNRDSRKVVYVGYGDFDQLEEEEENSVSKPGRTSTKNYKAAEEEPDTKASDASDAEEESSDEDEEGERAHGSPETPASRQSRGRSQSRSSSKQRKESSKAKEFRDKRKKKDIKLNQLTSISGSGASSGSPQSKSMTCFVCQQTGHKAADCPKKGTGSKRG